MGRKENKEKFKKSKKNMKHSLIQSMYTSFCSPAWTGKWANGTNGNLDTKKLGGPAKPAMAASGQEGSQDPGMLNLTFKQIKIKAFIANLEGYKML